MKSLCVQDAESKGYVVIACNGTQRRMNPAKLGPARPELAERPRLGFAADLIQMIKGASPTRQSLSAELKEISACSTSALRNGILDATAAAFQRTSSISSALDYVKSSSIDSVTVCYVRHSESGPNFADLFESHAMTGAVSCIQVPGCEVRQYAATYQCNDDFYLQFRNEEEAIAYLKSRNIARGRTSMHKVCIHIFFWGMCLLAAGQKRAGLIILQRSAPSTIVGDLGNKGFVPGWAASNQGFSAWGYFTMYGKKVCGANVVGNMINYLSFLGSGGVGGFLSAAHLQRQANHEEKACSSSLRRLQNGQSAQLVFLSFSGDGYLWRTDPSVHSSVILEVTDIGAADKASCLIYTHHDDGRWKIELSYKGHNSALLEMYSWIRKFQDKVIVTERDPRTSLAVTETAAGWYLGSKYIKSRLKISDTRKYFSLREVGRLKPVCPSVFPPRCRGEYSEFDDE